MVAFFADMPAVEPISSHDESYSGYEHYPLSSYSHGFTSEPQNHLPPPPLSYECSNICEAFTMDSSGSCDFQHGHQSTYEHSKRFEQEQRCQYASAVSYNPSSTP